MVDYLISLIKREPLVVVGALASALVALAANFNIVLDDASVQAILVPLVTALIGRSFVVPANEVTEVDPVHKKRK